MHCPQDVRFSGLAHGILLVIGQGDHVFALVTEVLVEIVAHVLHVIDTSTQLTALTEVVDSDKQGFATTGTVGVLERVTRRRAMAKGLGLLRRWRWC